MADNRKFDVAGRRKEIQAWDADAGSGMHDVIETLRDYMRGTYGKDVQGQDLMHMDPKEFVELVDNFVVPELSGSHPDYQSGGIGREDAAAWLAESISAMREDYITRADMGDDDMCGQLFGKYGEGAAALEAEAGAQAGTDTGHGGAEEEPAAPDAANEPAKAAGQDPAAAEAARRKQEREAEAAAEEAARRKQAQADDAEAAKKKKKEQEADAAAQAAWEQEQARKDAARERRRGERRQFEKDSAERTESVGAKIDAGLDLQERVTDGITRQLGIVTGVLEAASKDRAFLRSLTDTADYLNDVKRSTRASRRLAKELRHVQEDSMRIDLYAARVRNALKESAIDGAAKTSGDNIPGFSESMDKSSSVLSSMRNRLDDRKREKEARKEERRRSREDMQHESGSTDGVNQAGPEAAAGDSGPDMSRRAKGATGFGFSASLMGIKNVPGKIRAKLGEAIEKNEQKRAEKAAERAARKAARKKAGKDSPEADLDDLNKDLKEKADEAMEEYARTMTSDPEEDNPPKSRGFKALLAGVAASVSNAARSAKEAVKSVFHRKPGPDKGSPEDGGRKDAPAADDSLDSYDEDEDGGQLEDGQPEDEGPGTGAGGRTGGSVLEDYDEDDEWLQGGSLAEPTGKPSGAASAPEGRDEGGGKAAPKEEDKVAGGGTDVPGGRGGDPAPKSEAGAHGGSDPLASYDEETGSAQGGASEAGAGHDGARDGQAGNQALEILSEIAAEGSAKGAGEGSQPAADGTEAREAGDPRPAAPAGGSMADIAEAASRNTAKAADKEALDKGRPASTVNIDLVNATMERIDELDRERKARELGDGGHDDV